MATMIQNEDGRMGPIHWYDSMQRAPVLVRAVANLAPGVDGPVLGSPEWAAAMSGEPQNWGYYFGDKEGGVWRFGARVKEATDEKQGEAGTMDTMGLPAARAEEKAQKPKPLAKLVKGKKSKGVPIDSLCRGALFTHAEREGCDDVYLKTDETDRDKAGNVIVKCVLLTGAFPGLLCRFGEKDLVLPLGLSRSMKVRQED